MKNRILTQQENPDGLHGRYIISKVTGEPLDPGAEYFVLRIDKGGSDPNHIAACRKAALVYADEIAPFIPKLASDLRDLISE